MGFLLLPLLLLGSQDPRGLDERREDLRRRAAALDPDEPRTELQKLENRINAIINGPCRCGKSHAECVNKAGCHIPEQQEVDRLERQQKPVLAELKRRMSLTADLSALKAELRVLEKRTDAAIRAARRSLEELDRRAKARDERIQRLQISAGRLEKATKDLEKHEEAACDARRDAAFDLSLSLIDALISAADLLVQAGKMTLQGATKLKTALSGIKYTLVVAEQEISPGAREKAAKQVEGQEAILTVGTEGAKIGSEPPSPEVVKMSKGVSAFFLLMKASAKVLDMKDRKVLKVLSEVGEVVVGLVAIFATGPVAITAIVGGTVVNTSTSAAALVQADLEARSFRRLVEANGGEADELKRKIGRERQSGRFDQVKRADLKAAMERLENK
jgi:hypothetical protein